MADNYNLIPAAELPITEAKEVDVLCVENGEIKRKAAANLSGGGGGYVIHVLPEELNMDDGSTEINVMISESRDNFGPILEAGGTVWLDLSSTVISIIMGGETVRIMISAWMFAEGVLVLAASMGALTLNAISMNGTWRPGE